jgi:pilus assembly protein CpaE
MSVFSPLLIISYDPEERLNLSALASGLGYSDAHMVVGGIDDAIVALNSRIAAPDYLIIDIGDSSSSIFSDLDTLALHCDPKVVVVVIGTTNDINFYRELRSRGVSEYCNRPVQIGDLRAVLFKTLAESTSVSQLSSRGTVISCISAASGDGASTFAVNLAYCLAEEYNQSTVLIDMDYQFGLIAKSLDLTTPFGIRELFDYASEIRKKS